MTGYRSRGTSRLSSCGARRPIIPSSHAAAASATLSNSRVEIFEGVGHFPHCEDPERFVRVLTEFMDATESARVTDERFAVGHPSIRDLVARRRRNDPNQFGMALSPRARQGDGITTPEQACSAHGLIGRHEQLRPAYEMLLAMGPEAFVSGPAEIWWRRATAQWNAAPTD